MGGMYGRSSMYGGGMGGGMYGQQGQQGQQNSNFFVPKEPEGAIEAPGHLNELKQLNSSLLDSLHSYGDGLYGLVRRIIAGLAKLHQAVKSGTMSPAAARRAAAFAVCAAAFIFIALAKTSARRKQKRLAWHTPSFYGANPLFTLAPPIAMPHAAL